jgi:hypothetical protein
MLYVTLSIMAILLALFIAYQVFSALQEIRRRRP